MSQSHGGQSHGGGNPLIRLMEQASGQLIENQRDECEGSGTFGKIDIASIDHGAAVYGTAAGCNLGGRREGSPEGGGTPPYRGKRSHTVLTFGRGRRPVEGWERGYGPARTAWARVRGSGVMGVSA